MKDLEPDRRIDYVLVGWPKAGGRGQVLDVEVVGVEAVDGMVPSDHYGVLATLRRMTPRRATDDAGRDDLVGLVLGAGGVAGGAWHAGVLAALAEETGWDARSAAVIVGTSAGSIIGAALRSGVAPRDLHATAVGAACRPRARRCSVGCDRPTASRPTAGRTPRPVNPTLGLRTLARLNPPAGRRPRRDAAGRGRSTRR